MFASKSQFVRNSGRLFFNAVAATRSDGGIAGRIVLIYEPNFFQTPAVSVQAKYCNSPWAIMLN